VSSKIAPGDIHWTLEQEKEKQAESNSLAELRGRLEFRKVGTAATSVEH
jgi:hypothetical protein